MKDKIRHFIPDKKDFVPMGLAFGVSLLAKIPEYFAQGVGTAILYEKLKESPDLVPLGIAAYGIYTAVSMIVGANTLRKRGFNAAVKNTIFFRGLNALFPEHKYVNSYFAETMGAVSDFLGLNINPVSMSSNAITLITGDPLIAISHRFIAATVSGSVGLSINLKLLKNPI